MQRSTADRDLLGDGRSGLLRTTPAARSMALREPAAIASGTVIRAMFTSRVHKAPVARGHRSFILAKQEWK